MMQLTIKVDEETGESYIDFEDLKCLFDDPSVVDSYTMDSRDDGSILLEFFDKDGNVIPVGGNEKK